MLVGKDSILGFVNGILMRRVMARLSTNQTVLKQDYRWQLGILSKC
jgi:hypothetical protein